MKKLKFSASSRFVSTRSSSHSTAKWCCSRHTYIHTHTHARLRRCCPTIHIATSLSPAHCESRRNYNMAATADGCFARRPKANRSPSTASLDPRKKATRERRESASKGERKRQIVGKNCVLLWKHGQGSLNPA